jgi:hypothetical protein
MRKFFAVFVVAFGAASAAHAFSTLPPWAPPPHSGPTQNGPPTIAPEIDPAGAMSALTLFAGGLAVIRGRKRRR